MIKFCFVASGSKGNATLITDGETLIQIDMGTSKKALAFGASLLGKTIKDIDALFITHNHNDHVKVVPLFHGKVPTYASPLTLEDHEVFERIEPYVGIAVGKISVFPFSAHHDAPNPLNYLIRVGEAKLGYVTDTGFVDDTALSLLKDCDYYLFESNHDLEMLMKSDRPITLKRRIKGDKGHLSNVDSALYMTELVGPKTKAIYLAHLSEECNTEEKALATYRRVFAEKGIDLGSIKLIPTKQWQPILGGDA